MKCDEICERTQHSGGEKNIYIYEWRRQEEELEKLGKTKYL